LLNNALKFTREGEIDFGYKLKDDHIAFYVRDTGIGISTENQALIFQRFRQVDMGDTQLYGGNGLGLSISKALVEKLDGTLKVNSQPGNGSTFTFTIPLAKEDKSYSGISVETIPDKETKWNEKTILIVEDEVNSFAYLEVLLSASAIKTIHAWDGKEAVEMIKENHGISLVLMDMKMPVMDGYEATALIKKIRPELPVIAQTAFALSHDKEKSLLAGCDNYISKPIQKNDFFELLAGYLN
jgi:CheY-like chemotaxis protein